MATILLPELVRKDSPVGLKLNVEGSTVREALRGLMEQAPDLGPKLFKDDGRLRALFVIYVDGKDIRMLQDGDTPVRKDSEIKLFAALAGG